MAERTTKILSPPIFGMHWLIKSVLRNWHFEVSAVHSMCVHSSKYSFGDEHVLCIVQSNPAEYALTFVTVLEGEERGRHAVFHSITHGCSFLKKYRSKIGPMIH